MQRLLRAALGGSVGIVCLMAFGQAAAQAATATPTWAAYRIGPMLPDCTELQGCDDDITGWNINANGWVAGDAFPDYHWPWVWKEGTTPTLISPGHTVSPDYDETGFTAINSAGDTAGYTFGDSNDGRPAILDKAGTVRVLGSLAGSTGSATAYALNDSDMVAGESDTLAGDIHAFSWSASTGMKDLGTLGGEDSWAQGVDASGQIVGWSDTAGGVEHAFSYQSGHMTDLGTLGGSESVATATNLSGSIVGWADTATGVQHAFVRTGSTMTDIGKLLNATSSVANDITNGGVVVGTAEGPSGEFGWLYQAGKITNIPQRTMDCCHTFGGSLNKNLQIVPAEMTSETVPVLEPVSPYDENNSAIKYTGTWTRAASTDAWGGDVKSATKAGAAASFKFKGKRIWWIAPASLTEGVAQVFIDGALKATIDLSQPADSAFGPRRTAFVQAFASVGSHTIKIVVQGTTGHPTVTIDAFAVSQK